MVTAMIFAGGVGARMNSTKIPKQFLEVGGKPIIVRTLENFQNHSEVDFIVIACLHDWIEKLEELITKYRLTKVRAVVKGGETGYQSIHNGLLEVEKNSKPEDIVLICDGVRPLVSKKLITNCIKLAKENETAVPVTPSIDSVLVSVDAENCKESMPRGQMYITQAPQGYTIRKIMSAHKQVEEKSMPHPVSSSELLIDLGEEIKIFIGDRDNIKVTTPEDLRFMRAYFYYRNFKSFATEEFEYGI